MSLLRHSLSLIFWVCALVAVGFITADKLRPADAELYRTLGVKLLHWSSSDTLYMGQYGESLPIEEVLIPRRVRDYAPIAYLSWGPSLADDNGSDSPPRPRLQELATILSCLAVKADTSAVGIACPLTWADADQEMPPHMLSLALQKIAHTAIAQPPGQDENEQPLPRELLSAAIPPAQIEGDINSLPAANAPGSFEMPHAVTDKLLWAVSALPEPGEISASATLSCPLLVRMGEHVLPTLPLRLALAALGLSPSDVHVQPGQTIRIGERTLPLDARARTPLGGAMAHRLSLTELLTAPDSARIPGANCVILTRQGADYTDDHADLLARTVSLLLAHESVMRLPTRRTVAKHGLSLNFIQGTIPGRVLLVGLGICVLLWLPLLRRTLRLLLITAIGLGGAGLLYVWLLLGIWASVCAWGACWLTLILAQWALTPGKPKPEPPKLWD